MALLPNILTLIRLCLVPVFIYAYYRFASAPQIALAIYTAAMLTDALDGYLARRMGCESRLGAIIDPLADKLMTLSAISCLCFSGKVPYLALYLVAAKEILMIFGAFISLRSGIEVKAGMPGKIATALFTLSIALVIPWHGIGALASLGMWGMYVAIAFSFYAAVYYAVNFIRELSRIRV